VVILDHDIPRHQLEILQRARLRPQQIGREIGRPEWQDLEEILRYLHRQKSVTFFTCDEGFFRKRLTHPTYCIVVVSGFVVDTALYIRRFLFHPLFRTKRHGVGKVMRLSATGIAWWEIASASQQRHPW
jgi:hypothetical protein